VVSASLVPTSILSRGDFCLDQYRRYISSNCPEPFFVTDINGHLVSRYPVTAGVLATTFIGFGVGAGWIARTNNVFDIAKLAAAFIAATAVLAFFFAARELTDLSSSTFVTVAFAFGSAVWATASKGLWQHTPSILFHSIALWFILRGIRHSADALGPAGASQGLTTSSRPSPTSR
jgi:hypothetical protein